MVTHAPLDRAATLPGPRLDVGCPGCGRRMHFNEDGRVWLCTRHDGFAWFIRRESFPGGRRAKVWRDHT